jgi:hypothetical protein
MCIYSVVRAGWWRGIETEDAGRVYNCEVFAVLSHVGYFSNEYVYYQTLPEEPDTIWVTETEFNARLHQVSQEVQRAQALLSSQT